MINEVRRYDLVYTGKLGSVI